MYTELILMHKDIEVASIYFYANNTFYKVNKIFNFEHMPPGTRVEASIVNKRFGRWIEDRGIPNLRPNINLLYKKTDILAIEQLIIRGYGSNITDCYWFKTPEVNISWGNVNFYENNFGSNIGQLLLTNNDKLNINNYYSPDLMTNGDMPKTWMRKNGKFQLLKAPIEDDVEVINEYFASLVCDELGIEHASYSLTQDEDDNTYCICPSFLSNNQEFVSFEQLAYEKETLGRKGILQFINQHNFKRNIDKIIILDYLIANSDRHLGNIGIIRNADTLAVMGLAPVFDNGGCMNYDGMNKETFDKESKFIYKTHLEEMVLVNNWDWILKENLDNIKEIYKKVYDGIFEPEQYYKMYEDLISRIELIQDILENLTAN